MKTNENHQPMRPRTAIRLALAISSAALTYASAEPIITTQPKDRFLNAGQNTTFFVTTSAASPIYQWFFSGLELPGQTNRILTLTNATPSESGDYFAVVSD